MKPNATNCTEHQRSPDYIRELIESAGLSQRGAALQIGVTDRTMRNYCKCGDYPYTVQFTMERLADENKMNLSSDRMFNVIYTNTSGRVKHVAALCDEFFINGQLVSGSTGQNFSHFDEQQAALKMGAFEIAIDGYPFLIPSGCTYSAKGDGAVVLWLEK